MAPVPAMARKFETCPVKTPLTLDRGVLVMFPSDLTWPAGFCTITYQIYHIPHMFIQHQSQHCGNDPYESLGRKKKTCTAQMLESAMELWRHSGQFSNFQACLVKATTSLVLLKYAVLLMVLCKEPVVVLFQTIKPGCQAVKLMKWDRLTAGCMVKQAFLDKRLTATPNRSI